MKKQNSVTDELRKEYDFAAMADGVRGKYARRYRSGTNLIKIDPDVSEVFIDEHAVNVALRSLIKIARRQVAPAHKIAISH